MRLWADGFCYLIVCGFLLRFGCFYVGIGLIHLLVCTPYLVVCFGFGLLCTYHIGNVHKYARKEDVPEKTMFIITTDGYENASRRYDYDKVRKMIERQKEKYGWEFLFLGANIDAAAEAKRFGISADRAVTYKCDEEGTALNYEVIGDAVRAVRACKPLSANWKKRIDEDVQARGK